MSFATKASKHGRQVLVKYHLAIKILPGYLEAMTKAAPKRSREARTRGPDLDRPVNRRSTKISRMRGADRNTVTAPKKLRLRAHSDVFPPERLDAIAKMAFGGMTNPEIALALGVPCRTFEYWVAHSVELRTVLQAGKDEFDERIVRTLAAKALGYSYVEQEAIKVKTGQHTEAVEVVQVEKHQPADTTAIIFWLKNRQPQLWRDAKNIDVDGQVNVNVNQPTDRQVAMALINMLREAAVGAIEDGRQEPLTIDHQQLKEAINDDGNTAPDDRADSPLGYRRRPR